MNEPTIPPLAIAVLDKSFVYVGHITIADGFLTIRGGFNVRRWGTTEGLGQLATGGPRAETVLDASPDVFVPFHALIHLIAINPEKWPQLTA